MIIALLVGGEILGLLGVLLALPVAGILRVLWPDVLDAYRASTLYLGADAHPTVTERSGPSAPVGASRPSPAEAEGPPGPPDGEPPPPTPTPDA